MSSIEAIATLDFSPIDNQKIANLCGPSNENIKYIEKRFDVTINNRSGQFVIRGDSSTIANKVKSLLKDLYSQANNDLDIATIETMTPTLNPPPIGQKPTQIALRKKTIRLRNQAQINYINNIDKADVIFSVGPAGTGKTYLAVAKACELLEKGEAQRLIFVRPAVEAGEKLGFLPGDLVDKVLPYLRPIYDALYELLGFNETQKLIKNDVIEILPLAFMRGRTLNDAFIILDEAQNTTILQMKMFLTRIGFGSKAVITGDATQTDLPAQTCSGLSHALDLFKKEPEIRICQFTTKEVVRHPLVSKIIQAYDLEQGHQK